jgi:hypothetical protein
VSLGGIPLRLLLALSFAASLSGQGIEPAAAPACSLAGHVVNSVSGTPIRKAQVRLLRDTPAPAPAGDAAGQADGSCFNPRGL